MSNFGVLHWLILILIIGTPIYIIVKAVKPTEPRFCTTCGHEGRTKRQTRGSIIIEIFLWLLLIIPGVIYSLWRLTTRRQVCAQCGSEQVVPVTSPVAVKMRRELSAAEPTAARSPTVP